MNLLSYFAAVAAVIYLYSAYRIFRLDPRAAANRVGALQSFNFFLWAFASIFCYALTEVREAAFWYWAFSVCWNSFASFSLHFALRAAGVPVRKGRIWRFVGVLGLYGPAILFTIAAPLHMVVGFELRGAYLVPTFRYDAWFFGYTAYYVLYCVIAITVLVRARFRATGSAERRRLTLLAWSFGITLALGFLTDTIFLMLGFQTPNLAIIWSLIYTLGLLTAMNRFSFLAPFPVREAVRIVDAMADIFLYLDESGSVVWGNGAAVRAARLPSVSALRGRRFLDLVNNEGEEIRAFDEALSGKRVSVFSLVHFGAEGIPLAVRLSSISDPRSPGGFIVAGRDLTDSRRRERAETLLEETGLLLDNFMTHSLDGILVADSDGSVARWNRAMETITGITELEAIGTPVWDLLRRLAHPKDDLSGRLDYLQKALQAEVAGTQTPANRRSLELRIEDTRGRDRILQLSSFIIPLQRGNVLSAIARDITEERRAAEETIERIKRLDHAQKMESIGTLSSGLAHDFNNALGGIVGAVSLMRLGIGDGAYKRPEDLIPEIDIVANAADRAAKTVRRLLSLAKKRPHDFAVIDLAEVVLRVVEIARHSLDPSVVVEFDAPSTRAYAKGDAAQIEQLALNLVINAGHAMTIMRTNGDKRGGTVRVSVKEYAPSADFLAVNPAAEDRPYWMLSVKDHGVGVPYEIRSKIFDPFFTTKSAEVASGLGLAMVHSIAKQHGGFVEVDSEPGFGAEFQVYIPAVDAAPADLPATAPASRANGAMVLVAEDEDVLRSAVAAMLKALGYASVTTSGGQEAVDAFAADPERFAAVLLDVTMPGLSGETASARILEIRPDAPLVLTSGRSPEGAVEALLLTGRAEFLPKPYTIEELGAVLDRAVAKAAAPSAECG